MFGWVGGWEHGPAGCQENHWEWREGTDFSLNSQSHPSHSVLAHTGPGRPRISRVSHRTDVATSYSQRTTEEAKSNASLSRLSCHRKESQWGNCRSVGSGMNGACGLTCLGAIDGHCGQAVSTGQGTAHWAPQGPASLLPSPVSPNQRLQPSQIKPAKSQREQ